MTTDRQIIEKQAELINIILDHLPLNKLLPEVLVHKIYKMIDEIKALQSQSEERYPASFILWMYENRYSKHWDRVVLIELFDYWKSNIK